ncbi:LuxR family transcriptional regulator [Ensifer sp. ENS05]|uniref:helix-turn-helix transcriptional regulator n=1 Tax=Ensifer sp. ENS05 TaxID=2769277 RepID=UPI00177EA74C|nr:LuxR family transcriptional regulator [Ensifer sp. ENS05]MBD9597765.1 LuxR family transcriptional regulator [Ensifer sp. ENS05]
MHGRPQLLDSLELIEAAASIVDLQAAVSTIRDNYRLSHLVFHVVRMGPGGSDNPLLLLTYPQEWIDQYFRENFFEVDPVVALSKTGFLPVDWSSLDQTNSRTSRFFKQAESFEVGRHGVTMPVRGPRGERSLFTATSNLQENKWIRLRDVCLTDLRILSHHLHERALSISGLRETRTLRALSRREVQCLEFIARGKLPKQIAPALQISESAIRLYLRSAKRKLGVTTTPQAIVRAVTLELIHA